MSNPLSGGRSLWSSALGTERVGELLTTPEAGRLGLGWALLVLPLSSSTVLLLLRDPGLCRGGLIVMSCLGCAAPALGVPPLPLGEEARGFGVGPWAGVAEPRGGAPPRVVGGESAEKSHWSNSSGSGPSRPSGGWLILARTESLPGWRTYGGTYIRGLPAGRTGRASVSRR